MNYELNECLSFCLEPDMDLGDLADLLDKISGNHGELGGFTLTEITEWHVGEKTLFTLTFGRQAE